MASKLLIELFKFYEKIKKTKNDEKNGLAVKQEIKNKNNNILFEKNKIKKSTLNQEDIAGDSYNEYVGRIFKDLGINIEKKE